MDRRRFAEAATLAVVATLRPGWFPSAGSAGAARVDPAIRATERCIPALAVSLKIGQDSAVEWTSNRSMTVRFVAVEDDSRCPTSEGVACVWAGQATIVVELDFGGSAGPVEVRSDLIAGSVFQVIWGHDGLRLFVAAVGLSGDGETPREDVVLDLLVLPEWPVPG